MNYTIYPKKGKPFPLSLYEFQVESDRIVVHTSDSPHPGFLAVNDIAAIIPESQSTPSPSQTDRNLLSIAVYLRNHIDTPITVLAHAYKHEKDLAEIEFYWKLALPDYSGPSKNSRIYVASSEVIALVPTPVNK